jgi:D-alanyl-D-alanine carboxypeptidase
MKRGLLLLIAAAMALASCAPGTTATPAPGGGTTLAPNGGQTTLAPGGAVTPVPAAGGSATSGAGVTASSAPAGGMEVKGWSTTRRFHGTIVGGRSYLIGRMRWSWRRGCPVDPARLRLLQVDHWGFDRRVHRGELVVHRDHARRILVVLEKLFKVHYPIQRMRLVDAYRADDDRSMAANNTSGFNCRTVSGSSRWSEHAFGRAIDLNPLRNPYVTRGGRVSPPAGRAWANRARAGAAMIRPGDKVVRAFAAAGWRWGGYWSGSRDYQHFSATGR